MPTVFSFGVNQDQPEEEPRPKIQWFDIFPNAQPEEELEPVQDNSAVFRTPRGTRYGVLSFGALPRWVSVENLVGDFRDAEEELFHDCE